LPAQHQPAPSRSIFVAEITVGIQTIGQFVSQLAEQFGTVLGSEIGKLCLSVRAGIGVNPAGQVPQESTDHLHVCGIDGPGTLPGGGGRQVWGQRLAGDGPSRTQVIGFVDATAGFGAGDP
jgi:hypothetical protein